MNIFIEPKSKITQNVLIPNNIPIEHIETIINDPVITYPSVPNRILRVISDLLLRGKIPKDDDLVTLVLVLLIFVFIHLFISGFFSEIYK
jgi:hypothetical protein